MLLRDLLYLSDAPAAARQPRPRPSRLKPIWVIPRAWCATTVLQAKGVPRHKTAAFVRLNLSRLAPFVDCGVYACRTGDWVHLWFWENRRVRDFCDRHDIDFPTILLAPESVCRPKGRDGVLMQQCIEGIEAQLWQKGLLLETAWWPQAIDTQTWQAWRLAAKSTGSNRIAADSWPDALPNMAGLTAGHALPAHAGLSAPWAGNLLVDQWQNYLRQLRPAMFLLLATGLVLGLAGFWSVKWLVMQHEQGRIANQIEALSKRVEPLNKARTQALDDLQWTTQLFKLRGENSVIDVLNNLQPVLERQEALLREFEYVDGELRLLLVPLNSEINMAAVIQQLEAQPGLSNVRLLPDSDMRVLRVSAKMRGGVAASPMVVLSKPSGVHPDAVAAPLAPPLGQNEGKRERGE